MTVRMVTPDGEVVTVDEDTAAAAWQTGELGFVQGEEIAMRNEIGEIVGVAAEDAPNALQGGFSLAPIEELERADLEAEYGDFGDAALAGVEGFARGATFGLSDQAIAGLGGEDAAEAARLRREINPFAAGAGEVAGAVAPLFVPGGQVAGAGRALGFARAVSAPSRAVMRGAQAAESGVAAALRARGLGQGAARVAGIGAAGALEGAAQGVQEAITEDALGNVDLTAESLLQSVGATTLWGAGGGAVLGVGGQLARSVGRGAQRAGAASKRALKGVWGRAQGTELRDEAAEALLNDKGRLVQLAENADELRESFSARMREAIDVDNRLSEDVRNFAVGELKASRIRRAVGAVDEQTQAAVREEAFGIVNKLVDIDSELTDIGYKSVGNRLKRDLGGIQQRVRKAAADGDVAGTFIELDRFKRRLGKTIANTRGMEHEAKLRLESYYSDIRKHLEFNDFYGEAADIQRAINETWHEHISNLKQFDRRFMTETGERAAFRDASGADPRKLMSFSRSVGTFDGRLDEEVLTRHLRTRRELNDRITEYFDVPSRLAKEVRENNSNLRRVQAQLEEAKEITAAVNQYKTLSQKKGSLASRSVGALGSIAGGALGATTLGAVGGFAGLAAGQSLGQMVGAAAGDPVVRTKILTALQRVTDESDQKMARGVVGFLRASQKAARGAASKAKPVALRLTAQASRQEYDEKVEEITELAGNPGKLVARMGERLANVESHAPGVAQAGVMVGVRQLEFLQQRIPAGSRRRDALDGSRRVDVTSDTERERFMRLVRAVEDPMSVLDALQSGTVTREQVEVLEQVYPQLHARLVTTVVEKLAEEGSDVAYEDRLQLGVLLGVPTHRSLEPDVLARLQAAAQATTEQPQPPAANAPLEGFSSAVSTATSRFEGGTFTSAEPVG